jgi:cation diffusion facilitator CzcD-associated flavoprotein CzcO
MDQQLDVLIVGAGISGIGAACHLTRECPDKSFLVLERRQAIGGTWDLFRYPGIRSDSDMYSFAYNFRPWHDTNILAEGPKIKKYVEETAAEYGVTDKIRFGRKVVRARWSSDEDLWTVEASDEATGATERYRAQFIVAATGYYDYDNPYRPTFPGEEDFAGPIVHPQLWPEDLDYAGKNVVVIGSGATAITLVPAMAGTAKHVTMLQRTPTYVVALPGVDPIAKGMYRAKLPASLVYKAGRARNIAIQRAFYQLTRMRPEVARHLVLGWMRSQTRGKVDMKHFTPPYNPWDQRICVAPGGDLFRELRSGRASIVTDTIERFTPHGIRLTSGEEIPADIIVTATGLQVRLIGDVDVQIDGQTVQSRDRVLYKGVMVEGVPNALIVIGYTNASWTLKADLAAEWFCRLIKHMDAHGHTKAVAYAEPGDHATDSIMGSALQSGYIKRADALIPRQGTRRPWKILNDYVRDAPALRRGRIDDGVLRFSRATRRALARTGA